MKSVWLFVHNPASAVYVRNKRQAYEKAGNASFSHDLPESTTQNELLALIDRLNTDDRVDGILVQFPIPAGIDTETVIERSSPIKTWTAFTPTTSAASLCVCRNAARARLSG